MDSGEALRHVDCITLSTRHGDCEIQFLNGDIALLPLDEKVDIVIVSAFPNSYSAVKTSLIGALKWKQDINVQNLSATKEADLRAHYSCWISQTLPDDKPYRKLVCFEHVKRSLLLEQIGQMFRAFMPVFNGQETTVITSLLATGSQSKKKADVLKAMVEAAAYWIRAGLPLRCLKIVNYVKDFTKPPAELGELSALFATLKKKLASSAEKVPSEFRYDVYFIFSPSDESWVRQLSSAFRETKPDIRMFTDKIAFDPDVVWQKKIFQTMITSRRVVALLTPGFAGDAECLEQFNMAMCCCRLQPALQLLPFYLEALTSLPSYLALVQYVDCRIRREGDDQGAKIRAACSSLVSGLEAAPEEATPEAAGSSQDTEPLYDVFISYAHRQAEPAERLLQRLAAAVPDVRIFFDRSELKSGNLWQQTLYQAADRCRCMVALLNPHYLKSPVCREEYNVALARALTQEDFAFLPVCTLPMETVRSSFASVPMLDARENTLTVMDSVAAAVSDWLKTGEDSAAIFPQICRKNEGIAKITALNRKTSCADTVSGSSGETRSSKKCQVVFSLSQHSLRHALLLHSLLQKDFPETDFRFLSEHASDRLHLLESADLIVIFVCEEFAKSPQLQEELHVALCRQRAYPGRDVVYLIQARALPPCPTHLHLLPYRVGLEDAAWRTASSSKKATFSVRVTRDNMKGTYTFQPSHVMAARQAASDIGLTLTTGTAWFGETILVNVLAMDLENHGKDDEEVPLGKNLLVAAPDKSDELTAPQSLDIENTPVTKEEQLNSAPEEKPEEKVSNDISSEAPSTNVTKPTSAKPQLEETLASRNVRSISAEPQPEDKPRDGRAAAHRAQSAGNAPKRSSSCHLL